MASPAEIRGGLSFRSRQAMRWVEVPDDAERQWVAEVLAYIQALEAEIERLKSS